MKRSIHQLIPLPNTKDPEAEVRQSTQRKSSISKVTTIVTLMLCMMLCPSVYANFTVRILKPGLYIEHLGHSRIEKGIFRVQIDYNRHKMKENVETSENVYKTFENLCEKTTDMTYDTQCSTLFHHLHEVFEELKWTTQVIDETHKRRKRGILGKLLTSVFGVNDEVYEDIDSIQKNQDELLKAEHHQTKFMLSALTSFNETEARIQNKLELFRRKLNQALSAMNDMKGWFKTIDTNKLNIHILTSYEVANGFITEVLDHYSKLLAVRFRRGNLHELISPIRVNRILNDVRRKLPPTLNILTEPVLKTTMRTTNESFQVFSHFLLVGTTNFTLMKVTPIPVKISNTSYWEPDVTVPFLNVDYNRQLYYGLNENEFKSCILTSANEYVCLPTSVKNIETASNCVIDEVYQRFETTKCKLVQRSLIGTICKELSTTNAWMAVTSKPTRIAITCNGVREEVTLNKTNIIQIAQDCIIQTKSNILTPRRIDSIPVIESFTKTISYNFTNFKLTTNNSYLMEPIESVIKDSQNLEHLQTMENNIQEKLDENQWRKINHHSISISILTSTTLIIIMITLTAGYRFCQRCRRKSADHRASTTTRSSPQEGQLMELMPL
ncbi:unnamed protein product [Brassicogethes aeneus]|uniref:Envelope fusion protein n=1 Tax=Brassicogethes aeneus TaxID=1431903 RepID=A0A9P0B557_BRAAE|nr:unnamed protein product [Brassicogethes aeneus]